MSDPDKKILRTVERTPEDKDAPDFLFWCPGCKCGHGVWTTHPNGITGATWGFNGNMEKPTFTPSLKISSEKPVCHLNVIDGMLHFGGDSEHEFAGKIVPMEPF